MPCWARSGALLLSLLAWFSGCSSGTETGNPSVTGALSYRGLSSEPAIGVREPGSVATVQSAWLSLGGVTIARAGACGLEGDAQIAIPSLGVGDHATGAHNFTAYSAPAGSYCEVRLPFTRVASEAQLGSAPSMLLDHTILIEGTLVDGTAFTISSSAAPVIALSPAAGGFSLNLDTADTLMTFDFAAWLQGIDWAGAERSDGAITIAQDSNAALLAEFEAHLARGVALYRDRDGDGALDENPELLAQGHD